MRTALIAGLLLASTTAWAEHPGNPDRVTSIGLSYHAESVSGTGKVTAAGDFEEQDVESSAGVLLLDTRIPVSDNVTLTGALGFIGSKTEAQETPFLLGSESDVGGLGFTIGMRYYFTESSQPRTKSNTEYAEYRLEMEKLNFSREKSGLKPAPVMTYDQWAGNLYQPRPDAKVRTVDEWIEEDANRNLVPDSYERSR